MFLDVREAAKQAQPLKTLTVKKSLSSRFPFSVIKRDPEASSSPVDWQVQDQRLVKGLGPGSVTGDLKNSSASGLHDGARKFIKKTCFYGGSMGCSDGDGKMRADDKSLPTLSGHWYSRILVISRCHQDQGQHFVDRTHCQTSALRSDTWQAVVKAWRVGSIWCFFLLTVRRVMLQLYLSSECGSDCLFA